MRTGSLRAATQADPGQPATPQKVGSRAREKSRTELGTLGRQERSRASASRPGVWRSPRHAARCTKGTHTRMFF